MSHFVKVLLAMAATLVVIAFSPRRTLGAEPALMIDTGGKGKRVFTRSELLSRNDLETITVEDPAFGRKKMTYQAIKISNLLDDLTIDNDATIQFRATDGFAAPIPKSRLMNRDPKQSIAYLAIEPEDAKWPPLKPGKPSPGPFYLVWKNPELSNISPDEWPFMLASLEVKGSIDALYPAILPDPKLGKSHPARRGFALFTKNCFACHTMNKQGASQVGPDLNLPMNPTEYFKAPALKKLIRNPQRVRHWPQAKMPAFGSKVLSDKDIDDVIAYLRHMAGRKQF